jgi:DNA-binding CsgD family transcriptional regulator
MSARVDRASELADPNDAELAAAITAARGMQAAFLADWTGAETSFRRLVDLAARLPADVDDRVLRMQGGPSGTKYVMMARNNLAIVLQNLGRNEEAIAEAEAALATAAGVFERSIDLASLLDTCGQIYLALADTNNARKRFKAALSHAVSNANNNMAVSPLFGLARVAANQDDCGACLTFAAAARRAATASGTNWLETKNHPVDQVLNAEHTSRVALNEDAGNAAWERGLAMDIQAALEFAQSCDRPSSRPLLSSRELEVAQLVAQGLADKEIARRLFISSRTVEAHLARVRQKLGLHNRAAVAVWAVSNAARE